MTKNRILSEPLPRKMESFFLIFIVYRNMEKNNYHFKNNYQIIYELSFSGKKLLRVQPLDDF